MSVTTNKVEILTVIDVEGIIENFKNDLPTGWEHPFENAPDFKTKTYGKNMSIPNKYFIMCSSSVNEPLNQGTAQLTVHAKEGDVIAWWEEPLFCHTGAYDAVISQVIAADSSEWQQYFVDNMGKRIWREQIEYDQLRWTPGSWSKEEGYYRVAVQDWCWIAALKKDITQGDMTFNYYLNVEIMSKPNAVGRSYPILRIQYDPAIVIKQS